MLQIKDLSIYIKNDMRPLVKGLTFSLNSNDKVAVIGEEGNGKSTLLKAIYNPESVSDYAVCEGNIYKDECVIGYLSQEIENEYLNMDLSSYFGISHVTDDENIGRYARLLNELGLDITKDDEKRQ
ncbi:MAG: ATP-binding cassette domain-containing protein, partial [Clostridia bacterium]